MVAAISGAAVLFVKEVFHASLLLLICLICVAGIFVTFNAEFLAIVQILVYAGGVILLVVFGIMLTVRNNTLGEGIQNKVIPGVAGLSLFAMFVYALSNPFATPKENIELSPEDIGALLMTRHAIVFEIAGILLLVSLIGAIVAATQGKRN
jgi:NADH-quinone oxidoreductase subunit J